MDRPRPIEETTLSKMPELLDWDEKGIKTALVLGGSSGLGKALSQLLLKNDTFVCFSYCQGREDAEAIVKEADEQELNAQIFRYDALGQNDSELELVDFSSPFDFIFFSITPKLIFNYDNWDERLFERYQLFYVSALEAFIKKISLKQDMSKTKIMMPSTVAIDETTHGLAEYIQAKLLAEKKLLELSKRHNFEPIIIRFPLLPTELTNRPGIIYTEDIVDNLIKGLKAI